MSIEDKLHSPPAGTLRASLAAMIRQAEAEGREPIALYLSAADDARLCAEFGLGWKTCATVRLDGVPVAVFQADRPSFLYSEPKGSKPCLQLEPMK